MGDVTLTWTGAGLQFRGLTSYGDPIAVGGSGGSDAKPSDLLPLSLAACTAYDIVEILRKQRQELRSLVVTVRSVQDPEPPWTFRAIHMSIALTGEVDARRAARAIDLAEGACAVAATLRPVVELTHSFTISPA